MARLPRLYAPDTPQLALARFARPLADARDPTPTAALDQLHEWLIAETLGQPVRMHGWVLLPDRLALLATPSTPLGLSRVIQGMGRRMATKLTLGRVFEGRYRSALLDAAWVPACLVWAESLPMRSGFVDSAARWPWSSAQEHVGLRGEGAWLTDHASYWELGNTPFARQARYLDRLRAGVRASEEERIERALFGQWALGDDAFVALMGARGSRRVSPSPRGRPRKSSAHNAVTN